MGSPTAWSGPPSEATSCSAIQEVPDLLRNLEVHYNDHKTSPLVPGKGKGKGKGKVLPRTGHEGPEGE
jgi:hypothetical protein